LTVESGAIDPFAMPGDEDRAGIVALTELVSGLEEPSALLSVPVSALTDQSIRRPVALDEDVALGLAIRPRVLLVEDNPMNRLMVGVLLDRLGLDHVAVGCAQEAILRFAREAFDAILLDVEMDGMAGLATARAITALAGDAAPPLVALGRADLDEDALDEAGFSAVAEAPLDTRRLAAALIAAVENSLIDADGR
jgi:CheY-like chemotaxis protein